MADDLPWGFQEENEDEESFVEDVVWLTSAAIAVAILALLAISFFSDKDKALYTAIGVLTAVDIALGVVVARFIFGSRDPEADEAAQEFETWLGERQSGKTRKPRWRGWGRSGPRPRF